MKFIITEEQSEKLNQKIKSTIEKYGIDHAIKLFGDDIIRRAYHDILFDYLNQFNNLTPVKRDDKIFYVDKDRLPLFYYYPDEKNGFVFINHHRIWMFFEEVIGLEYDEIKDIIKNWLEETYNLRGLTPTRNEFI